MLFIYWEQLPFPLPPTGTKIPALYCILMTFSHITETFRNSRKSLELWKPFFLYCWDEAHEPCCLVGFIDLISWNRWVDKQSVVQPYNGLLFGNQMNELLIWAILSVNFKTLCFVKEASPKRPCVVWFLLCEMSRTGRPVKTKSRFEVIRD